jgi:hypothetical protein
MGEIVATTAWLPWDYAHSAVLMLLAFPFVLRRAGGKMLDIHCNA